MHLRYRYNYRGLDYTPFIYIQENSSESYLIRIGHEYYERKTKALLSALKNSRVNIIEYTNV